MLISYARSTADRNFHRMYASRPPHHGQEWPDGWRIEVTRRPTLKNLHRLQINPWQPLNLDQARQVKSVLRPGLVLDSYRLPPVELPHPFEVEAMSGWWKTETGATFKPGMAAQSITPPHGDGALLVGREWRIYCPSSPRMIDAMLANPLVGWDREGRYWTVPGSTDERRVYGLHSVGSSLAASDWAALTYADHGRIEMAEWLIGQRDQRGLRNRFGYDHTAISAIRIGRGF